MKVRKVQLAEVPIMGLLCSCPLVHEASPAYELVGQHWHPTAPPCLLAPARKLQKCHSIRNLEDAYPTSSAKTQAVANQFA